MTETFHQHKGYQIVIKQIMKRHKGQKVRTIVYRFKIWTADDEHQYTSKKSESLATESAALREAQQIIETILTNSQGRQQA